MKNLRIPGVPVVSKFILLKISRGGGVLRACIQVRPNQFNRSANSLYGRSVVLSAMKKKHSRANYDSAHCHVRGNRRFERRNWFHFPCWWSQYENTALRANNYFWTRPLTGNTSLVPPWSCTAGIQNVKFQSDKPAVNIKLQEAIWQD